MRNNVIYFVVPVRISFCVLVAVPANPFGDSRLRIRMRRRIPAVWPASMHTYKAMALSFSNCVGNRSAALNNDQKFALTWRVQLLHILHAIGICYRWLQIRLAADETIVSDANKHVNLYFIQHVRTLFPLACFNNIPAHWQENRRPVAWVYRNTRNQTSSSSLPSRRT